MLLSLVLDLTFSAQGLRGRLLVKTSNLSVSLQAFHRISSRGWLFLDLDTAGVLSFIGLHPTQSGDGILTLAGRLDSPIQVSVCAVYQGGMVWTAPG